jgi:quercetin dioxygenase-like cupin family protein
MPPHRAKGTVIIQVIEGKLALDVVGVEHFLEAGGVLVLGPGVQHDVNALEKSLMLLTVCLDE